MGLRQSLKPRHQVLINRCYPKYQESNKNVQPNYSDLRDLLDYSSTRRSKLQKAGTYLEKRTASDVGRRRLGNVQVTLQILAALIEESPEKLPVYAQNVLNIFHTILQTNDIRYVEASVPTFTIFCTRLDHATFAADPLCTRQYDDIIRTYASFVSKPPSPTSTGTREAGSRAVGLSEKAENGMSVQDGSRDTSLQSTSSPPRFKTAGLRAVNSLVSATAFQYSPNHLKIVLPAILEQLTSHDPGYLTRLEHAENDRESLEKDSIDRRRPSIATTKSIDIFHPPSNMNEKADANGDTTKSEDRAAEQIGLLALQALRSIFSTNNEKQISAATSLTVKHMLAGITQVEAISKRTLTREDPSPVEQLFDRIADWTPVRQKFVVVTTLVEVLENLSSTSTTSTEFANEKTGDTSKTSTSPSLGQLALISTITRLLRSHHNFIGLPVISILISLLQIIRARCDRTTSSTQTSDIEPLLIHLRTCIAALACRIHYPTQISNMISTIVAHLPGDGVEGEMRRTCIHGTLSTSHTPPETLNLSTDVRNELGLSAVADLPIDSSQPQSQPQVQSQASKLQPHETQQPRHHTPDTDKKLTTNVLRVEDLKRALALSGAFTPTANSSVGTGSESLISASGFSGSEQGERSEDGDGLVVDDCGGLGGDGGVGNGEMGNGDGGVGNGEVAAVNGENVDANVNYNDGKVDEGSPARDAEPELLQQDIEPTAVLDGEWDGRVPSVPALSDGGRE